MADNIDIFRKEYLGANTWEHRKDGVPLYLLDKLSFDELKMAEAELIRVANIGDDWPILGLGYIKSTKALPTLYDLLEKGRNGIKVAIACSIFQICRDPKMIDQVLEELPKITNRHQLIDVLYLLPGFNDEKIMAILHSYREHKEYLVAYNATRALGLPTDEVVKRFVQQGGSKS